MVDPLKEKIIARIKRDWPTSLKAWDERNSFYAIRNNDKTEDYRYPEPCSVIRLARRFDLDIPRHILFFDLSNRDPLIDFGVPFEGLDYVYGLGARWDLISPEYRKIAAVGNRKMVNWFENRETQMSRCLSATFLWPCYDFQTRMTHQIHVKFISGYNAHPIRRCTTTGPDTIGCHHSKRSTSERLGFNSSIYHLTDIG